MARGNFRRAGKIRYRLSGLEKALKNSHAFGTRRGVSRAAGFLHRHLRNKNGIENVLSRRNYVGLEVKKKFGTLVGNGV
jgi:hypothetical protein